MKRRGLLSWPSLVSLSVLGACAASCGDTSRHTPQDTESPVDQPDLNRDGTVQRDLSVADFDARGVVDSTASSPAAPLASANRQLLETLQDSSDGELFVSYSNFTGQVSRLTRRGPTLTGPNSESPQKIADDFLARYGGLFGLSGGDLANSYLSRDLYSAYSGATHLTYQFTVGDLDVFSSVMTVNIDADGRVVNASGQPIGGAEHLTNTSTPQISEAQAVAAAAEATFIENVASSKILSLVYFPLSSTQLRLAYRLTVQDADSPNLYECIVDASNGKLLWRHTRTYYDHIPTHGEVYTDDSPEPDIPAGTGAGIVARDDVPFTGELAFPHDDPHFDWWATGSRSTTTSNNVDAYADRDGDDAADSGSRPTAGAGEDFTFAIDLSMEPDTYQDAAVVNLFYWNNRLHDFFYQLGFDEAAGNFQSDNFSLGGSDGDAVNAEAQDNADGAERSLCNANMSTVGDGTPPKMQMYLCDSDSPERDGDLDNVVIAHEYTHGVHTRLLATSGSQAANEGWSDYYGLAAAGEMQGDPYDGQYGVGNYLFDKDFGQGIRSYPYSTDTSVFQLSYLDLNTGASCAVKTCSSDDTETCSEDEDCSTSGDTCDALDCQFHESCEPPNTTISQGPCRTEVHFAGSIWTNALHIMRHNIIAKEGYEAGAEAANRIVLDGMKMSPDNPTFLDGRDALLSADEVDFDGVNRCLIWDAFAKSGMGYTAETTGVDDIDPLERFDLPSYCAPTLQTNTDDTFDPACVGDTLTETLSVFNAGKGELIVTDIEVTGSSAISVEADPEMPAIIGSDSHMDFTVRCTPTSSGTATATVRISSNDSENPTQDIQYSCEAGEAEANVALAGSGEVGEICPAAHGDLDLTVLNQGTCDLRVSSISLSPGGSSFELPDDLDVPLVLARGADFRFPVRYSPNACTDAVENATVRLSTNDPGNSLIEVDVSGSSPCGDINVAIADSGDFGAVCSGDHADLGVTLFNQGRCDLTISDIAILGGSSFELPSDLGLPLVLSHDADFNLPVRYAPTACSNTTETAILRLTTDDPDEPTVDVALSGVAPCPKLVIDPPGLDDQLAFPTTVVDVEQNLGCYADQSVNVRNFGLCPLVIDGFEATDEDFTVIEPTQFPIILPPGEETLGVTVRFAPLADDAPLTPTEIWGALTATSNDPDGPLVVDLCGESADGSGVRVLVSDASGTSSVPVSSVERITVDSSGINQPGPVNLTYDDQALVETSVCGRTVRYHANLETLPATETTGNDPNSSYEVAAKQGQLQSTAEFSLAACEFKEVQLELSDPDGGGCTLLGAGEDCTVDAECCSGNCTGAGKCN